MSLLKTEFDVHISERDLKEINMWAVTHANECPYMQLVIQGHGVMHYGVEHCGETGDLDIVGYCPCGCRYYVGDGEEPPVGN